MGMFVHDNPEERVGILYDESELNGNCFVEPSLFRIENNIKNCKDVKKEYNIVIVKEYKKEMTIEASSEQEARKKAEEMYVNDEIELNFHKCKIYSTGE